MKRISVESSNIESIGYDETNDTLEVEFIGGAVYQYFDVPQPTYEAFKDADSKGEFFCQEIKNVFRYARI